MVHKTLSTSCDRQTRRATVLVYAGANQTKQTKMKDRAWEQIFCSQGSRASSLASLQPILLLGAREKIKKNKESEHV